jgi:hypothetical protein
MKRRRGEFSEKDVQEATAFVAITPQCHQTAFLISDDGVVATAGHGFVAQRIAEGDTVSVHFLGLEAIEAVLVERVFDESRGLDYALLRCIKPVRRNPIPLSTRSASITRKSFFILGYRAAFSGAQTRAIGTVKGTAVLKNGLGNLLELASELGALEGLSGGAVVSPSDFTAYAIQSSQLKSSISTMFAVPLEAVRRESPLLDEIIRTRITPLDFEPALLAAAPRGAGRVSRVVLVLAPLSPSAFQGDVLNALRDEWLPFTDRLQKITQDIRWVARDPYRAKLEFVRRSANVPDAGGQLWELADTDSLPEAGGAVRVVLDLVGNVSHASATRPTSSHVVGIRIGAADDHKGGDPALDQVFEVSGPNAQEVARKAFAIIEDIAADIFVFNSMPVANQLFPDVEARRALSGLKVGFAHELKLNVYGRPWPHDSVRYVSFRGCSRAGMLADPDGRSYHQLWRTFVEHVAVTRRDAMADAGRDGQLPALTADQVVERILQLKRYSGQINVKRLRRQLAETKIADGEIGVVGLSQRKPGLRETRDLMAQFFGRSQWHPNMTKVTGRDEMRGLLKFREFVRVYFFRMRRTNGVIGHR